MPRQVSIRTLLVFGFGGLLALSLVLVTGVAFRALAGHTFALVAQEAGARLDAVSAQVALLRSPIETQAAAIADAFARDEIGFEDREALRRYLQGVATAAVTPRGLIIEDLDRRGFLARLPSAEIVVRDPSDESVSTPTPAPDQLPNEFIWTRPLWIEKIGEPALGHLGPLRQKDRLVGVLVQAMTIRQLSNELARLPDVDTRVPFMLYGEDAVIAHPSLADGRHRGSSARPLPTLGELGDPVLAAFAQRELIPPRGFGPPPDFTAARLHLPDARYIVVYRTTPDLADRPVTVGVYFHVHLTRPTFVPLITLVGIGLGVLLASGALAYRVSRTTAGSMSALAQASSQVARGALDDVHVPTDSRLREVAAAANAFDAMVDGLRERERIRDLFGRVMPPEVAARMLAADGTFEPVEVDATVLFCDLAGFTALCEDISPAEVVHILNAYFHAMVEIIAKHGGIITQFQGDAILTAFNVPEPLADHPQHAVAAAVEIADVVATTEFAGRQLAVRIGVNTGLLVAGNVGAEHRMNYTVHGDCVNVAARLEQMNKDTGTVILVSESTAAQVRNLPLREVGTMPVRGRETTLAVYTPAD